MDSGTLGVVIVMGGLAVWGFSSMMKRRREERELRHRVVVVGRPIAPPSNILKNIFVIAILGGLAWFFWWATHTKFWP
jgi:hypothetical protein